MNPLDWYDAEFFRKSDPYEKRHKHIVSNTVAVLKNMPTIKVLDVGCGIGYLVKHASEHHQIDAYGLDFSPHAGSVIPGRFICHDATKGLPFPADTFDVVFSSDFFEHLKEEDIDTVATEMKRVGKNVVARISFQSSRLSDHADTHLTVKSREWWIEKLPGIKVL